VTPTLEPEPVIVSLNTELYLLKCQVLLLGAENQALRARLAQFTALATETQKVTAATA